MSSSVVDALRRCPLGTGASDGELAALATTLPLRTLDAGAALITAGEAGDAAYVLVEGELEIIAPDGTFLDREGPGALVGEQALLPHEGDGTAPARSRNATVRATTACRLLEVKAAVFATLAADAPRRHQIEAGSDDKTRNRLGRLSAPFARLLQASERRTWTDGEVVFEEGDPADGIHIVLAGQAAVVATRDGGPVHLATVYPGRVFGEIATLRNSPRTASVVARPGLRTAFVPALAVRALQAEHPALEAFLGSLLRSHELPHQGALHQRTVFTEGAACTQTVYALDDGRTLTALRTPTGRYTLQTHGATAEKTLEIAPGTTVGLDASHRIVALQDAGACDDVAGLQSLALDGAPLSLPKRRALRKAAREAALQAPDAVICRCLHLDRATLQAAIDAGAATATALQAATGCGSVCGGCMRKTVPAMLAAGAAAAPALPDAPEPPDAPELPAAARLPEMPRFLPWLGNFSFSRDPAGFQRRGHARLGPVFGARLMGKSFVFIDPVAAPALAAQVLAAPPDQASAEDAWNDLMGDVLGEDLARRRPALSLSALDPAAAPAVAAALAPAAATDRPVDLRALTGTATAAALGAQLCGPDAPPAATLAGWLSELAADLTAFGALLPIHTPAARRRVAAREALVAAVGLDAAAALVASWHNAQTAVLQTLIKICDSPDDPDAQARMATALAAAPPPGAAPESLAALAALVPLHTALAATVRAHGGGAVWRRAAVDIGLPGGTVPAGTLVGTVVALAQPAEAPDTTPPVALGGRAGLFDEAFGSRGPAGALPEAAAMLVLRQMLRGWTWRVVAWPRRRLVPIVPGMRQLVGAVRAVAAPR